MTASRYQAQARGETSKRLLAQLINEELAVLDLLGTPGSSGVCPARITGRDDAANWITLSVADCMSRKDHLRPDDFQLPITLCSANHETVEDDPGSIFEFGSVWFECDAKTRASIADELRNSAMMLERWMELGSGFQALNVESSFLDWERSIVTGHPTHPFHRTCFAISPLAPIGPDDLPQMRNPDVSFVTLPRTSVLVFGPFVELMQPMMDLLGVPCPTSEEIITVPCLSQHLPALLHFFPEAKWAATIPKCAVAQAAIRTVSVPGCAYDIKFSLACLITSAVRVLPCWSAAAAPSLTSLLKRLVSPDLWVLGEVAAVTGSRPDTSEARYLTCILRENLEAMAHQNDEALILSSALMERPRDGRQTYAEILFDLRTAADKMRWFKGYIQCLLPVALEPLRQHQVGFEFHAQNSVVRVCKKTKAIKGFAIRDLAGVKLHGPTLKTRGFDITNLSAVCTDKAHEVWDRVHHALLQNNVGYMLYALGLERNHDGWGVVRSVLRDVLVSDGDTVGRDIYQYFVKEMMPFKSFLKIRMQATFKASFKIVEKQVPNVLWKAPWLSQISLAGTRTAGTLFSPGDVDPAIRARENDIIQETLIQNVSPYGQPSPALRRLNPYPMVLPLQFLKNLEDFHEALALALDDIIGRWWADTEADFPCRMPLEPQVEGLLKWIDDVSDKGSVRPYKGHQGNLRPDVLIPVTNGRNIPEFRICEINARFPISYLHFVATAYEASTGLEWPSSFLKPATDHNALFDSLLKLFDPAVAIHFVGETSDFPPDSPLFGMIEHRTGMRPRSVKPSSLRLVPSDDSPTGFHLYCVWGSDSRATKRPVDLVNANGELLERVHQVGLQLYDFELFSLPSDMVRHIAMCSVNDMRSVFIAHDKRILGIVREELNNLVHKHHILTVAQAESLEKGLVPTFLPASSELRGFLKDAYDHPEMKDGFILKPFRQARGSGILLGKDLSTSEWCSILESMQKVDFDSSTAKYTLQPFLQLQPVDIFWDEKRKVRKSRMVGAYYSINGQFIGLGMWRTASVSEDVISASTKDATSLLSAVYSDSFRTPSD